MAVEVLFVYTADEGAIAFTPTLSNPHTLPLLIANAPNAACDFSNSRLNGAIIVAVGPESPAWTSISMPSGTVFNTTSSTALTLSSLSFDEDVDFCGTVACAGSCPGITIDGDPTLLGTVVGTGSTTNIAISNVTSWCANSAHVTRFVEMQNTPHLIIFSVSARLHFLI